MPDERRAARRSAGDAPLSLLFVNQHYYPDVASTGQHLTDLAEYLAARGSAVEVLAGRGRYVAGRLDVSDRELRRGVRIRRVRTTGLGRSRHVGRLLDYASYYLQVIVRLLIGPRRDGVILLTTPPFLAAIGACARVLRGQRYGVWSMDLHPEAEIASGMLRAGGLVARMLGALDRFGLRRADFVVDLGAYMKRRLVALGVAPERTRTIPVWSAGDEIVPVPRDANPLAASLGLRDRFVVMYSGNAGIVHDFRDILEAMRRLSGHPRMHFLFVGDGPRRAEIEAFARAHRIANFEYRPYFRREELRWSLALGDVHLISLRAPFVGISVPGKLQGILAAGRPALFVGPGACEVAETIAAARCGAVIDPERGDAPRRIVETLTRWAALPALIARMGVRARAEFERSHDRLPNCDAWSRLLRETWGRATAHPNPTKNPFAPGCERADGRAGTRTPDLWYVRPAL